MHFDPDITLKVLVADDDPLVLWTSRRSLEEMGCHVTEAATAFEAEEMCRANHFDLVILDYRLADGLGTDILKKLRSAGYAAHAVCVTGEAEFIPGSQRDDLGIFEVLNKPLDIGALKKTVAHISELCRKAHATGRPSNSRSADNGKRIGRFEVVKCPARLGCDCIAGIKNQYQASDWLALDMSNTCEIEDQAIPLLLRMAENHSKKGSGRFCLAGLSDKLWLQLEKLGLYHEIDMLRDIEGLDSLSRRLTSISERISVLDSVITRA